MSEQDESVSTTLARYADQLEQADQHIAALNQRLIDAGCCPECGGDIKCHYSGGKAHSRWCLDCGWRG